MPVIPVLLAILMVILLIWRVIGKIRHGGSCCGEHEEAAEKVRVPDHDPSHYPYRYRGELDGMVCGNCVRAVENAFHAREGVYAKADLEQKTVRVLSKAPLSREAAVDLLKETSYTLLQFEEERE